MELRERLTNIGLLWLRVLTGLGIASHGYQKLFGGIMPQFMEGVAKLGLPAAGFFAHAAGASEFFGGLLIALGLFTRVGAVFVFFTMSVAAFHAHAGTPFSERELPLAYWTVSSALVLLGAGRCSLDWLFFGRGRAGKS